MARFIRGTNDSPHGKGYDQRSGQPLPRSKIIQNWDGQWINADQIEEDPRKYDNFEFPDDPTPVREPLPRITNIQNGLIVAPMHLHWSWTHPMFELEPPASLRIYLWLGVNVIDLSEGVFATRHSEEQRRVHLTVPAYSQNTYIWIGVPAGETLHAVDFGGGINQVAGFQRQGSITLDDTDFDTWRTTNLLTHAFSGLDAAISI